MKTISLIGLPGSGKTTLGKRLSQENSFSFLDFDDDIIEKTQGASVADILTKLGEEGFKQLEEDLALDIKNNCNTVLATSGSLPYSQKAMDHLGTLGPRVYLKPPIKEILDRCASMKVDRIIGMGRKSLEEILQERSNLYTNHADTIFEYSGRNISEIGQKLIEEIF